MRAPTGTGSKNLEWQSVGMTGLERRVCRLRVGGRHSRCSANLMNTAPVLGSRPPQALQVVDLLPAALEQTRLITRRSQVQILSPQPNNQGLAAMRALFFYHRGNDRDS